MTIRTYCRRSKNDEGKQQFSLDVQAEGCAELIARLGLAGGDAAPVAYVDDGRSGDDFLTRAGLRKLIEEARQGDLIVCRDQSRLGRDAIEVTLVVRELVRDRGCRLFYYATGQEVPFANAIDQATTFILGTGHQIELEAIRSRTREALRSRARDGRVAGGSCYGYTLERGNDGHGRRFTRAVVNEREAAIVRRIYAEYLAGRGLKQIAHRLNADAAPPPSAGRRGSGSWAPTSVRVILMNPRYRGLYLHGRIKKVRKGGNVSRVRADAREIIATEIPEWRIVDDETWFAVEAMFTRRPATTGERAAPNRPACRYALTGIAKCGVCGGAIVSHRVRTFGGGAERVLAYGCGKHRDRGTAVCAATVYQHTQDVEDALIAEVQAHVLSETAMVGALDEIRRAIADQLPKHASDLASLEAELATMRGEQRRLAKAVALADDIPELVSELAQRSARIRTLEAEILAARRTPDELRELVERVESTVRANIADLRRTLTDRDDLRHVFKTMFPEGLTFTPARTDDGARQIWKIEGTADIGGFADLPDGPVSNTTRPQRDLNPCRLRERQVS